jgi:predicted MFS family arabinose efflux permease
LTGGGSLRLAGAGIGAVGTAFGMARYGYGLLLPDMQREYRLNPSELGAIGAGSYAAYLVATVAAGAWADALGPRLTVVAGGVLAAVGMMIAGVSGSALALAAGVLLGGASCGLVYPPLSDAVAGLVPHLRARTLSMINCGTGYGVAFAAPVAIMAGGAWREVWLAFAGCAVASTLWAGHVLPRRTAIRRSSKTNGCGGAPGLTRGFSAHRGAAPLLVASLLVGLGSAAYWTFGVDELRQAGGLSVGASRAFLGVVGIAGVLSSVTGDLVMRYGGRRVFTVAALTEAASIALLSLWPTSLTAALVSAVLFGASFNAVVAVEALWSMRLYADRPSLGLAAAMAAMAVGQLGGPLISGTLASSVGLSNVLLGGALVTGAAALAAPGKLVLTRDAPERRARLSSAAG